MELSKRGTKLGSFVLGALLVLVVGCGSDDERAPWLRELPDGSPPAVGERVWALVPWALEEPDTDETPDVGGGSGAARLALLTVAAPTEAETGTLAEDEVILVDALGRRHVVPVALTAPTAPASTEDLTAEPWLVARDGRALVGRPEGDGSLAIDHNGVTLTVTGPIDGAPVARGSDGEIDLAFPESLPARVLYDDGGVPRVGLAMAATSTWVWLLDDGGFGRRIERAAVETVRLASPTVGEAVRVYDWVDGVRTGVVVEEVEPGLRYRVERDDGTSRVDWFADLLAP